VSHTTDDLVFVWLPEDKVPLAVDSNFTGDCTSVYSTGLAFFCSMKALADIFYFKRTVRW
jgi:hypothetical protein